MINKVISCPVESGFNVQENIEESFRMAALSFYRKGNIRQATLNLKKAINISNQLGLKEAAVDSYNMLSTLCFETGNLMKAARHKQAALELEWSQLTHDYSRLRDMAFEMGCIYLKAKQINAAKHFFTATEFILETFMKHDLEAQNEKHLIKIVLNNPQIIDSPTQISSLMKLPLFYLQNKVNT